MMMTRNNRRLSLLILFVLLFSLLLPGSVLAQSEKVQVVLFYSPFCGHCQQVIAEEIPPIVQAYNTSYIWSFYGEPPDEETGQLPPIVGFEGDVLQILYVDTTTQIGGDLYLAAVERFQIVPEDQAVPTLVIGEELLIGGVDIPNQLPIMVDAWLSEGGLPWPDISGLEEVVTALVPYPDQVQESPTPEAGAMLDDPVTPAPDQGSPDPSDQSPSFELDVSKLTVLERIQLDPVGNALSIVVLIGMLFSLVAAGMRWRLAKPSQGEKLLPMAILVFVLLGIGVAGYLSFVATSGTKAVCGPVGDCNTVQASKYSHIIGILPNGILGLIGYVGMLAAWVVARRSTSVSDYAVLALFGMALFGTAFSIYLTYLEPFVIGATCMWCLSSAIIVTVILLLSVDYARAAFENRRA
jgi:uncharacterized membrane protein/thiol-disulfide isomerase/thioredoxin